ncbi:mandelate racemase [Ramlibacter sp. PS3R-8]|uniref:mandelate racemase n=1 Tax=Ramlibacter sp. PS3R-8 TaxID=3133437 RepID=UPI0030968B83
MTEAMRLKVCEVDVRECAVKNRLPFRFGNSTKTHGRQVVVRARIALPDGRSCWGAAAEALSAKWFDKNPALSDEDNYDQLRLSIELAAKRYREQGDETAFDHFVGAYEWLNAECARFRMPALIAGYGAALLDRCIVDALGRLTSQSFWTLMRGNAPGLRPTPLTPDLVGFDFDRFLRAREPLQELQVRHTVGLVDPIVAADQPQGSGPADGLPETLQDVVATYRHRYYKIKVAGDPAADLERLSAIASVLDQAGTPYHVTLDGNEQFRDVEPVVQLLRTLEGSTRLRRFHASILWLEQPLARDVALTADVRAIDALRPVVIDESDATLDAFPKALELGYRGVSTKNCKGLYKSILNRARCDVRNSVAPGRHFMAAEDLTTLPGISLQQDLGLVSLLGLSHVEKNAHHFIDGMRHRPQEEQRRFAAAHPDLYRLDAVADGHVVARLKISEGSIRIGSLDVPGHSHGADLDWTTLESAPPSRWPAFVKEDA